MKPTTDRVGNELVEGDFVSMMVQSQRGQSMAEVFGHVVKLAKGGIVTPGGQRGPQKHDLITPGVIKVRFEMDVYFDPQQGAAMELLKIYNPAKADAPGSNGKPGLVTQ